MSDPRTTSIGRLAAAGWLLAAVAIVRIATNGSFTDLAIVSGSTVRNLLAVGGVGLILLAIGLAALLVARPGSRVFTASWLGALLLASYGIVQLALRHESAVIVLALGAAIGVLSIFGWRRFAAADQP